MKTITRGTMNKKLKEKRNRLDQIHIELAALTQEAANLVIGCGIGASTETLRLRCRLLDHLTGCIYKLDKLIYV